MTTRLRIGIDLGGTKIEGAAIDEGGVVRDRRRAPTPAGDYQATIAAIARHRRRHRERDSALRPPVGIGMPGAVSPATGLVKNANSTWLIGRPLQRDLEAALGRPVRLANDANCFALSEAIDGAAAGLETVFGVILGTGVGGGIVDRRTGPGRRQRDRRRMGSQPAALAGAGRDAGAALLVRPVRLHRDLSVGAGPGCGPSPSHRAKPDRPGDCRAPPRAAMPAAARPWRAIATGSPAASPRSST